MKSLGGLTYQGYANSPVADVRPDHQRMRISGTCTSGRMDRSREIVVPAGVDWSEYRTNPIFSLNHGWRDPGKILGTCEVDGQFAVREKAYGGVGGWDFTAQLVKSGPNARIAAESLEMVDMKILKGVSLGFRFLSNHAEDVKGPDGLAALRINKCTPYEITLVPVPDNPDAVVRVVEKSMGGRKYSDVWLSILRPMVPKRNKSVGFTPKTREKAMPQLTPAPGGVDPSQQDPSQQDPAMGQQPQQPAMPSQKPSIALMLAAEQYTMGFIRFLNDQLKVQENPQMKELVPGMILHLSQLYRTLANAHQQIQMEDQTFPNLMGHGGMLASDPTPDGGAGGLGFGDELDGATGQDITAASALPPTPGGDAGMGDPTADPSADPAAMGGAMDDGSGLSDEDVDSMGGADAGPGGGSPDLFDGMGDDDSDLDGNPDMTDPDIDGDGIDNGEDAEPAPTGDDPDGDEEEDDDADTDGPPVKKTRQKAHDAAQNMILLIREKGFDIAIKRADKLLSAHEAAMKRVYGTSDLNWLRWGADNLEVAPPEDLKKAAQWMRQKALQGVHRPLTAQEQFERDVIAETERLLLAARQNANG